MLLDKVRYSQLEDQGEISSGEAAHLNPFIHPIPPFSVLSRPGIIFQSLHKSSKQQNRTVTTMFESLVVQASVHKQNASPVYRRPFLALDSSLDKHKSFKATNILPVKQIKQIVGKDSPSKRPMKGATKKKHGISILKQKNEKNDSRMMGIELGGRLGSKSGGKGRRIELSKEWCG